MMGPAPYAAPESLARLGRLALAAGLAGVAACLAGAFTAPQQLARSYLTGYVWMLAFPAGCLGLLLLSHLTRGAWGVMIRRILEAGAGTLPFAGLAFLPVAGSLGSIYEWSHAEAVARDRLLQHKAAWLNPEAFLARAAAYFALWLLLAALLTRWSTSQDATADRALARRMQRLSAFGFVAFVVTMSLASFDWTMSLTPHWSSTIYGLYVIIGQAVAAMALVALVALVLEGQEDGGIPFQPRHLHDYGKLLFTFVCVWAYFAYSQFVIIWSGNLPEETSFYAPRMNGAWRGVTVVLVLLHYGVPFALLLSRGVKRKARTLAPIAALLLLARWLDVHWLVAPAFSRDAFSLHWLDAAVPLALGGLWLWLFTVLLRRRPLLPLGEPFLAEALAHD